MSVPKVAFLSTGVDLSPSPINRDWIIEGAPAARSAILSRSGDGTACSLIWDCTAGVFHWRYDIEETIHILEGAVVIDDGRGPRHIGPGEVVFFPAGSSAVWRVEKYVRKLAFCRRTLPAPIGAAVKVLRTVKRTMRRSPQTGASLMQSA